MSLPPLPNKTISGPPGTGEYFNGHTDASMQAYGQQCREAALEEATDAIEDANARRVVYLTDAIEIIRSLK